ncbi:histidine phosphatase family protein [Pseudovibrio sp. Ad37]|uniref:histidine phosphatase family protein n=1 Tax=Pseudovibrio sp. Ad37 TaxID=989422 RepID=UPI0007AE74FE|nr:histidine phosphatase family protein [Pseudovibrio sp. Ad37]KZL26419.1 putative phosphoserine phosphatase 2 [Pseudovibrio sp. Ad37]
MLNELILLRHGESEHMLKGVVGGWTDSILTPLGVTQAKQTADYLAKSVPTHAFQIFTSDLTRAVQTAEWITAKTGKTFLQARQLRELNNGVAKDLSKAEAQKIWISPTEPILDWIPYDQGESWRMLYSRIATYMEYLATTSIEKLIIISHANSIICIINWWLGLSSDTHLQNIMHDIRPCSLTHLKREKDGSSRVIKLNDVSHLME